MSDTDFAPDVRHVEPEPRTVGDARDQISETRHRISDTLDAIELRIVDTKQEIRRRADVLRPVRERVRVDPWKALAIAAGAGLALGLLTGGSDEPERRPARARPRRLPRPTRGRGTLDAVAPRFRAREFGDADVRELESDARDYRDVDSGVQREEAGEREWGERDGRGDGPPRSRAAPRRSTRATILDHALRALADAVTDGLRERLRRGATS